MSHCACRSCLTTIMIFPTGGSFASGSRRALTLRQSTRRGVGERDGGKQRILIQERKTVVADDDVFGEVGDLRRGVFTGFLFFRQQRSALRTCSFSLVRRGRLFGLRCATRGSLSAATRVVALCNYRWWFCATTLFRFVWVDGRRRGEFFSGRCFFRAGGSRGNSRKVVLIRRRASIFLEAQFRGEEVEGF